MNRKRKPSSISDLLLNEEAKYRDTETAKTSSAKPPEVKSNDPIERIDNKPNIISSKREPTETKEDIPNIVDRGNESNTPKNLVDEILQNRVVDLESELQQHKELVTDLQAELERNRQLQEQFDRQQKLVKELQDKLQKEKEEQKAKELKLKKELAAKQKLELELQQERENKLQQEQRQEPEQTVPKVKEQVSIATQPKYAYFLVNRPIARLLENSSAAKNLSNEEIGWFD